MPVQVFLNFSRNNGRSKWRVLSKPECWIKVIFGGPKCSIVRKMLWNDCTKLRVIPKWWIYFYLNNLHNMFAWSFYHHYYFRTMTVFRVPVDYLQQKMDNCTWNLNNLILGISNQNFSSSHLTGQWDESLVCCGDHCTDGQHQGRVPSPAQSQLLHNTNYNSQCAQAGRAPWLVIPAHSFVNRPGNSQHLQRRVNSEPNSVNKVSGATEVIDIISDTFRIKEQTWIDYWPRESASC